MLEEIKQFSLNPRFGHVEKLRLEDEREISSLRGLSIISRGGKRDGRFRLVL